MTAVPLHSNTPACYCFISRCRINRLEFRCSNTPACYCFISRCQINRLGFRCVILYTPRVVVVVLLTKMITSLHVFHVSRFRLNTCVEHCNHCEDQFRCVHCCYGLNSLLMKYQQYVGQVRSVGCGGVPVTRYVRCCKRYCKLNYGSCSSEKKVSCETAFDVVQKHRFSFVTLHK